MAEPRPPRRRGPGRVDRGGAGRAGRDLQHIRRLAGHEAGLLHRTGPYPRRATGPVREWDQRPRGDPQADIEREGAGPAGVRAGLRGLPGRAGRERLIGRAIPALSAILSSPTPWHVSAPPAMSSVRSVAILGCLSFAGPLTAGDRPVTFERDVEPLLTRAGCNAGACHGKARGQNGFALSLLAFDPDTDYAAIVKEGRGRRVFPADPESSLLLRKPSATVAHGGGKRLPKGSPEYETVRRWIAAGTPRTPQD